MRETVSAFLTTRDGEAACALLTDRYIEEFTGEVEDSAARAACANEVAESVARAPQLIPEPDELAFGSIEVENEVATAVVFLPDSGTGLQLSLRMTNGTWLIDAVEAPPSPDSTDTGVVDTGVFGETGF